MSELYFEYLPRTRLRIRDAEIYQVLMLTNLLFMVPGLAIGGGRGQRVRAIYEPKIGILSPLCSSLRSLGDTSICQIVH